MKREIKFRGWHKKQQKMFLPDELGEDQLTISVDGRGFINVNSYDTNASIFVINMIPMQFTGLKDREGREIYEGDILKYDLAGDLEIPDSSVSYTEEVHFVDGGFELDNCPLSLGAGIGEVIGNIYQNPELLK